MKPITVGVTDNAIVCGPGGGHVRARKGDKISWDSTQYKFTLRFALLTGSGEPNWPFQGPAAPPSQVKHFEGTLALADQNDPPAYKYTVMIEGYVPLDPIIIVDK